MRSMNSRLKCINSSEIWGLHPSPIKCNIIVFLMINADSSQVLNNSTLIISLVMKKPERPKEGASATEIQEYLDAHEAWCQHQGLKRLREGREDNSEDK